MKRLLYLTAIFLLFVCRQSAYSQDSNSTDDAAAKEREIQNNLGQGWTNAGAGNYKDAIAFFQKASSMGSDEALKGLGFCYVQLKDGFTAIGYYQTLAAKGDFYSLEGLANIYKKGENGVNKDTQKAIELYQKAIMLGDKEAMSDLGDMYQAGEGVQKNYVKALQLYTDASQDGSAPDHIPNLFAMESIGLMYEQGAGVKKDINTALTWYRRALNEIQTEAHGLTWLNADHKEKSIIIFHGDAFNRITAKVHQLENPQDQAVVPKRKKT